MWRPTYPTSMQIGIIPNFRLALPQGFVVENNNISIKEILQQKKSRIRETKNLSTDADSSTDAIGIRGL